MVSMTTAKSAAERYADEFVGTDANMEISALLVHDETFQSLAIANDELGAVGIRFHGACDDNDAPVSKYTAAQTDVSREAVRRAMATRASEVFTDAYALSESTETDARVEEVSR